MPLLPFCYAFFSVLPSCCVQVVNYSLDKVWEMNNKGVRTRL